MHISEYENIYKNESRHFFYVGNHNTVLSLLSRYLKGKDKNKIKILDAGCGTGLLAQKMKIFGRVVGIDLSLEAIKFSKIRGVEVKKASVTSIPFPENTFDAVVSIDVLYHQDVDDVQKAINEFYRVLSPGGLLILKVPAFNWLRGNHDITVHTKHRFTTREIEKKLKKSNFKIKKITYYSSFLLPLAIIRRVIDTVSGSKESHSDVEMPNRLLNSFLILLFKIETIFLRFGELPFGLSVLVIAQKAD